MEPCSSESSRERQPTATPEEMNSSPPGKEKFEEVDFEVVNNLLNACEQDLTGLRPGHCTTNEQEKVYTKLWVNSRTLRARP
jgi:hypothetical protein